MPLDLRAKYPKIPRWQTVQGLALMLLVQAAVFVLYALIGGGAGGSGLDDPDASDMIGAQQALADSYR